MNEDLRLKSEEVMADVRSAAWLEQELHPDLDRHRRHQMADICEPDNVERVWRTLGLAIAEVRLTLLPIVSPPKEIRGANDLDRPDEWTFSFLFKLPSDTVGYLREKIHDFLVAKVMADRAEVIIPQCAGIWRERGTTALAEIRNLAVTSRPSFKRVRRPLWPG